MHLLLPSPRRAAARRRGCTGLKLATQLRQRETPTERDAKVPAAEALAVPAAEALAVPTAESAAAAFTQQLADGGPGTASALAGKTGLLRQPRDTATVS